MSAIKQLPLPGLAQGGSSNSSSSGSNNGSSQVRSQQWQQPSKQGQFAKPPCRLRVGVVLEHSLAIGRLDLLQARIL